MISAFKTFLIFLLLCGVFGADEVKSVMKGDSVTLNTGLSQTQTFNLIKWWFGGSVIAQTDGKDISYPSHSEIFGNRLLLDQTGFLTIKNMRTKHSGLYKLQISHDTGTTYKEYNVTVYEPASESGKSEITSMSVMEGDSVTLQTDLTDIQGDELIVWRFGDEGKLIAEHDIVVKSSLLFDAEERFRDRLKLDQTGSLIITNTRTNDSGFYTVKISSNKQTSYKSYAVTISALPVPDPGYSGGAVAGIVVGVLLVCAAVAAVAAAVYFLRPRTIDLPSETWSVSPGDIVTLDPETVIKARDDIEWMLGEKIIAGSKGGSRDYSYAPPLPTEEFRLRKTGSLSVTITAEHAGLYTLRIKRGRETFYQRFTVSDKMKKIYMAEGEDFTLNPENEIQKSDEIRWLFEDFEDVKKWTLLAVIEDTVVTKYDDYDERFKGRVELDDKTASLTIRKFTSEQAGYYNLKIRRGGETIYKIFRIFDQERTIEVMEGEDVPLNLVTDIKKDDVIKWQFTNGPEKAIIAEIRGEPRGPFTHDDVLDGIFRGRLKLETNRSLTIMNTRSAHTGYYTPIFSRGESWESWQTFFVTVRDKAEEKSVKVGDDVTLEPGKEIQTEDQILWMFKDKLIAQIKGGSGETYDDADERFRHKLKLEETGSLTITNITTKHTGLYNLQIISSRGRYLFKKFRVSVHWDLSERKESVKENNDSRGNRGNESATVEMPLLNGEDEGEYANVMNEEGMSSL